MIVVSKKNTKRLIKGERYEVVELKNSDTSRSRTRYVNGKYVPYIDTHGYLYIKDPNGPGHIGLSTSGFSDIDGKELPKIDWGKRPASPIERYEFKDLKRGDILVCRSRRYKHLNRVLSTELLTSKLFLKMFQHIMVEQELLLKARLNLRV